MMRSMDQIEEMLEWIQLLLNASIQQLERELFAFRMDQDDEEHGPNRGDA